MGDSSLTIVTEIRGKGHLVMHIHPTRPMHYALCIMHPISPRPMVVPAKIRCNNKFMHYHVMHYEKVYCTPKDAPHHVTLPDALHPPSFPTHPGSESSISSRLEGLTMAEDHPTLCTGEELTKRRTSFRLLCATFCNNC